MLQLVQELNEPPQGRLDAVSRTSAEASQHEMCAPMAALLAQEMDHEVRNL